MTQDDINALLSILQRAPLTQAEALWVREFLRQLQAMLQQEPQNESVDRSSDAV